MKNKNDTFQPFGFGTILSTPYFDSEINIVFSFMFSLLTLRTSETLNPEP